MQTIIELPQAFSVRDDHEFYAFQHLATRLNPQLKVAQVATGKHINGGTTVFWGVMYLEQPTMSDVELALTNAGFHFNGGHKLDFLEVKQ
jgi:hypothetical protein